MIVKSLDTTYEYVPECDRKLPAKEQTVFVYKAAALDQRLAQTDEDQIEFIGDPGEVKNMKSRYIPGNSGQKHISLLKDSLVEIKNLHDDQGNTLNWGKGGIKDKILAQIYSVIPELARVILGSGELSEEKEKN